MRTHLEVIFSMQEGEWNDALLKDKDVIHIGWLMCSAAKEAGGHPFMWASHLMI